MSARRIDESHTIVADEPLGHEGLDSLRRDVIEALDAGAGPVVIDMSKADGIDGACLSVVLQAARTLPDARPLSVIVGPALARSFAEWRVDTVVGIVEAPAHQVADSSGKE